MLKNYFKTTWRNFLKFKVFSFINIGGLALGIASCLALLLYVSYEWGYDKQFDNYKNIYRVYENQSGGNTIYSLPVTPAVLAGAAQREIPGIRRAVRFLDMEPQLLSYGESHFLKSGYYADSPFFQLFSYHFIRGNRATALQDAHSIVLTRKMAGILFGPADPMGKTVLFNKKEELQVSGVVNDLPSNETLQFDYILPWSLYVEENNWIRSADWGSNNCYTFLELSDQAAFAKADALLRKMVKAHQPGANSEAFLHPMSQWHLYSKFENGKLSGGLIEQVRLFAIMAIGILLIACINFMNLSTARSQNRAREVGLRKAIGSSRNDLIRQFFMESFFFSTLASLLAILLLEAGLPFLNRLLHTDLHIPYSNLLFWMGFALLTLLTGLVAGSYPSLYLSSFNPIKVLKGLTRTGKGALRFRQTLVVFQFTLALFLILSTAVIYRQIEYIRNKPVGFNTNELVEIQLQGGLENQSEVLTNELLKSGGVLSVCKLSHSLTNIWNNGWGLKWPGKREDQKILVDFLGTGYGFSRTTGVKITAGRDFSPDHGTDSTGVLINETAAGIMQLKDPIGARLRLNGQELTVVGVFRDFVSGSPFKKVSPMVAYLSDNQAGFLSVRLNPGNDLVRSVGQLETILKKLNPGYPAVIHFVDQDFERNYRSQKITGSLSGIFGLLAILICCMGLFGLAAFAAEQRIKEIGIRKVLGARVYQIAGLLTADFLKLVILSALIAFPFGWVSMTDWLQQFDYRISVGWWVFLVAGLSAFGIVLITVGFQAIRAALANPVDNLRNE
jgi:putative ABC transport system permease protein